MPNVLAALLESDNYPGSQISLFFLNLIKILSHFVVVTLSSFLISSKSINKNFFFF